MKSILRERVHPKDINGFDIFLGLNSDGGTIWRYLMTCRPVPADCLPAWATQNDHIEMANDQPQSGR